MPTCRNQYYVMSAGDAAAYGRELYYCVDLTGVRKAAALRHAIMLMAVSLRRWRLPYLC